VPISHIVALVGDSAYLPCDISTTHEGDSVHLVLWYREDLGTSVYSIDARNREFGVAERWSDNSVFSNRAYFMLDKQPAQLGVENTREEDAGIYRCRVDFQIGQTRNSKVNLTVIVFEPIIIIGSSNPLPRVANCSDGHFRASCCVVAIPLINKKYYIIEKNNVRRNYFSFLKFFIVREYKKLYGKPAPMVSWYRNDRFVTNRTTTPNSGVTRSEIVVQNLSRDDVYSVLTCNATNNNRSIPLSSSVRVDMRFSETLSDSYVSRTRKGKPINIDIPSHRVSSDPVTSTVGTLRRHVVKTRTRRVGDGDEMIARFSPQHGIRMDDRIYGRYGPENVLRGCSPGGAFAFFTRSGPDARSSDA
ncbi:hypothetical protein ALC57_10805, partial [Trachymyrmex cornetzi]